MGIMEDFRKKLKSYHKEEERKRKEEEKKKMEMEYQKMIAEKKEDEWDLIDWIRYQKKLGLFYSDHRAPDPSRPWKASILDDD